MPCSILEIVTDVSEGTDASIFSVNYDFLDCDTM